jgi:hypothetical protein
MPASGKPFTGKGGTVVIANAAGEAAFTFAAEVEQFTLGAEAEEITGVRLVGRSFKETDDPNWTGEFTLYAAKTAAGVAIPFDVGDLVDLTATFGGNVATGEIRILSIGEISVVKGNFITCPIKWVQDDDAFTVTLKMITVA